MGKLSFGGKGCARVSSFTRSVVCPAMWMFSAGLIF